MASAGSLLAGISAADEIGVKPDGRAEYSRDGARSRFEGAIALDTEIDEDSGAARSSNAILMVSPSKPSIATSGNMSAPCQQAPSIRLRSGTASLSPT